MINSLIIYMKNLSIRKKITVMFTLSLTIVSLILLLVFRYICGSVLYNNAKNNLINNINASVNKISYYSDESFINENDNPINYENGYLVFEDELFNDNNIQISIYGKDNKQIIGDSLIAKELRGLELINNNIFKIVSEVGTYQVYERNIKLNNDSFLWIRGIMSLEEVQNQLRDIAMIAIYVLLIVIILASLFAYTFAYKLIKPVIKINDITSDIYDEKDLKKRINIFRSNDEVNQLANSIDEMIGRLEEAFNNKSKFISAISQEIKTPLSVVIAKCEYMLDRKRNEEDYKEAFRTILKQSGRMHRLIKRINDYINLDAKQKDFPISDINLSSIVNDIGMEMKLLKDKNIELYLEVEDDIYIRGNRILQTCLVENIISNAYRYGRENGYIKVRLFSENDKALLEVEDNGFGISEESIGNIFNAFHQTNNPQPNGYGLGLSMAKKIVEFHRGSIDVKSNINQGSCFRVVFNQA